MSKTNKIIVGVIIAAVLLLGIGYAAINNITLNIRGQLEAQPNDENFKVKFDSVENVSDDKVTAEITNEKKAIFNVTGLDTAGQEVYATYVVKNESADLSAKIDINATIDENNIYADYFNVKANIEETLLNAGESTTVTVTARLEKTPINEIAVEIAVTLIAQPVQPGEEGITGGPGMSESSNSNTLAQKITPVNYGDYVKYELKDSNNNLIDIDGDGNPANDWKLFYSDGNNAFIITSDYIDPTASEKIEYSISNADLTVRDNKSVYWSESVGVDKLPEDVYLSLNAVRKFLLGSTLMDNASVTEVVYENYQKSLELLDYGNWSTSLVNADFAEKAIGGATREMWIASWNEKYGGQEGYSQNLTYEWFEDENQKKVGYKVGKNKVNTDYIRVEGFDKIGNDETLYFPYTDMDLGGAGAYWLASPSSWSESGTCTVINNGDFGDDGLGFAALRPVVMLKSDVKGTLTGSTWELSK